MRESAMEGFCVVFQKGDDKLHPGQALCPGYKLPANSRYQGHHSKTGSPGGYYITGGIPLTGQAANRVAEIIKIFQCLLFNKVQQLVVADYRKFIGGIDGRS